VSRDCYAILGVTSAAEDVVIGAAYRALMRHYHPDTNSDPDAQAKAREITAAYAMLRNPAKRAEYDARRAAGADLWLAKLPPLPPRPPAMRGVGIASALVALVLVGAVWSWPQTDLPKGRTDLSAAVERSRRKPAPEHVAPAVELEPESERLARLGREILPSRAPPTPRPTPTPTLDEMVPIEPAPTPPRAVRIASARPAPAAATVPRRAAAETAPVRSPTPLAAKAVGAKPRAAVAQSGKTDRLATLDRMSSGFFSQSMVHADAAKKELLLTARGRFAARRSACHSESCVAGAYLGQMREISAIMEGRASPAQ
jgi:hypothetical protein